MEWAWIITESESDVKKQKQTASEQQEKKINDENLASESTFIMILCLKRK